MIEPHDAIGRAAVIRACLADNDVGAAIRLLLDFASDFSTPDHTDEVTVLSMSFRRLEDGERVGVLDFSAASQQRCRLAFSILQLMRMVQERLAASRPKATHD
jgi:hypothetical protein